MPGVTVMPQSPRFGGFGTSAHNGLPRSLDDMTVAEIRSRAQEAVQKVARGASAINLISSARQQLREATVCEETGDLKEALNLLHKAAALSLLFMNSTEVKTEERGKRGVLLKEFMDYEKNEGHELRSRIDKLEKKLLDMEKLPLVNGTREPDGPIVKSGGSIADRMRALQDSGLSVSATKRFSREIPNFSSTTPISPDPVRTHGLSSQGLSSPPPAPSILSTPCTTSTSMPSPHDFVPPSTLGPPSPTSSSSSSPRLTAFNLSEFTQNFPSIDELDELEGLKIPPAPTGANDGNSSTHDTPSNPHHTATSRAFPLGSIDPGPRPSSTPLVPIVNTFVSRPVSPEESPASPPKPSSSPPSDRPSLLALSNTVQPNMLYDYMYQAGISVLLLDVRNRADFDREHIKANSGAVVCLEPSILMRTNVTGQSLEDALSVAPREELVLFGNRDKFDIVVLYDGSSTTHGPSNSPLSTLVRVIYETEFKKNLKHIPVLLVGGLEAWKKEVGKEEIVREGTKTDSTHLEPQKLSPGFSESSMSRSLSSPSTATLSQLPTAPTHDPHQMWTPPPRSDASTSFRENGAPTHAGRYAKGREPSPSRSTLAGVNLNGYHAREPAVHTPREPTVPPTSRVAVPRPPSHLPMSPPTFNRSISDNTTAPSIPQHSSPPIQYPQFTRQASSQSPSISPFNPFNPNSANYIPVSMPPQASINPTLPRRRSDYQDQSQEALSTITARPSIDYPDLSSQHILRLPPAAASSTLERHDSRPRHVHHSHTYTASNVGAKPPTIQSDYPVTYWPDAQIGYSGLKNLGNTCYMNATIQCLSATVPFARFFTEGRWKSAVNMVNPLGTHGNLANAFAQVLHELWKAELPYISPFRFRQTISMHAAQFRGSDQHDSQEFLSFLLDGLHEDLNRVLHKPPSASNPDQEAELERLPQQIASDKEWRIYRMRNDSLIVDFFQGQFRNRLECLTCHKTSTTYNSFMYLTLPVPTGRGSKVSLNQCLDAFVKEEVMEKNDAWHCPNCKSLRKTTKQLSLSRLPPVLLIHLKRFSVKGPFTDKIETFVDFPLAGLDLTNYMPPPLPPGVDKTQLNGGHPPSAQDPRTQMPPYKYDLYAVTNHFGSLSGGHYTAFVSTRGGWAYCDDSSVKKTDFKEVVGRPAYILFYKRAKT